MSHTRPEETQATMFKKIIEIKKLAASKTFINAHKTWASRQKIKQSYEEFTALCLQHNLSINLPVTARPFSVSDSITGVIYFGPQLRIREEGNFRGYRQAITPAGQKLLSTESLATIGTKRKHDEDDLIRNVKQRTSINSPPETTSTPTTPLILCLPIRLQPTQGLHLFDTSAVYEIKQQLQHPERNQPSAFKPNIFVRKT